MVYRVIYTTVFCLVVSHTSAQENSAEVLSKNQIDVFYHTDHFFDNSETYWLKFNPTTFGLDDTRKIKGKHNITASVSFCLLIIINTIKTITFKKHLVLLGNVGFLKCLSDRSTIY